MTNSNIAASMSYLSTSYVSSSRICSDLSWFFTVRVFSSQMSLMSIFSMIFYTQYRRKALIYINQEPTSIAIQYNVIDLISIEDLTIILKIEVITCMKAVVQLVNEKIIQRIVSAIARRTYRKIFAIVDWCSHRNSHEELVFGPALLFENIMNFKNIRFSK